MHGLGGYLVHAALWSIVRTEVSHFVRTYGAGPVVAVFVVLCVAFFVLNKRFVGRRRRARS